MLTYGYNHWVTHEPTRRFRMFYIDIPLRGRFPGLHRKTFWPSCRRQAWLVRFGSKADGLFQAQWRSSRSSFEPDKLLTICVRE